MISPIVLSWSGGKDCTLSLFELKKVYSNIRLLSTISSDFERVSMHGVKKSLFFKQIQALGLEVDIVSIPYPCSNEEYESKMREQLQLYKNMGVQKMAFGDLYLEDVRKYREEKLNGSGIDPIFPVWDEPTDKAIRRFINLGFKSIVTCVDTEQLDKSFCGRILDEQFLNDLPENVDPCGENGEFHTFVFDGPIFKAPVNFKTGEFVMRDNRFYYTDLLEV